MRTTVLGHPKIIERFALQERCNASCVILDKTKLWVIGGDDKQHDALKTTEFLQINDYEDNDKIPEDYIFK